MRYLSPEWIDAAGDALAADRDLAAALDGVTLTIEQQVDGGPDGPLRWHVRVDADGVALASGPAPHADLRFSTDYATASAIAEGTLAAQRAFVEGRLRVGGDVSLLMTHQRSVAAIGDALAPLRARTTT